MHISFIKLKTVGFFKSHFNGLDVTPVQGDGGQSVWFQVSL